MASKEHEDIRARQIEKAKPYSNHKPSDESVHSRWIYALRPNEQGGYPQDSEDSGKWLIFPTIENVDQIWGKIKNAVENGLLGNKAKVASAKHARDHNGKKSPVTCVYTYNWKDKEDVFRIREELRRLGISERIGYKADEDTNWYKRQGQTNTMARRHGIKDDQNIRKYWA